jgi:N utilization substance protein B
LTQTTEKSAGKPKPAQRRKARRFLMQALYQYRISGDSLQQIELQFMQDHDMKNVDVSYFRELLKGIGIHQSEIEGEISSVIDRKFTELDPVELSILQMGVYELLHRIDVTYRVVINEAVELAKVFGSEDGHKYVNSILDKLSKIHRISEQGGS